MWQSPMRLYLTADEQRAVGPGDPDAHTLLCPAGGEIPLEQAIAVGLVHPEPEPEVPSTEPATLVAEPEAPAATEAPASEQETASEPATDEAGA